MKVRWLTITVVGVVGIVVAASFFQKGPAPKPYETPLMLAARQGNTKLVKELLDHGADAHTLTPDGKNAMDYAITGGVCQLDTLIAMKQRVPDLQLHEPSPLWRNVEVAKLKACAVLNRIRKSW